MSHFTTSGRHLTRALPRAAGSVRTLTTTPRHRAEGDTGATRAGGVAASDSWTRRAKASEDMYIKEQEKLLLLTLREKIAAQEAALEKDRALYATMATSYGELAQEKEKLAS